eukprot:306366-Chlamydomonas_euryale.AAC.7
MRADVREEEKIKNAGGRRRGHESGTYGACHDRHGPGAWRQQAATRGRTSQPNIAAPAAPDTTAAATTATTTATYMRSDMLPVCLEGITRLFGPRGASTLGRVGSCCISAAPAGGTGRTPPLLPHAAARTVPRARPLCYAGVANKMAATTLDEPEEKFDLDEEAILKAYEELLAKDPRCVKRGARSTSLRSVHISMQCRAHLSMCQHILIHPCIRRTASQSFHAQHIDVHTCSHAHLAMRRFPCAAL